MYVKIDQSISEELNKYIIADMCMGSHAHGTNDIHSDIDSLRLYTESNNELVNEDNGWQYTSNNSDANYQSLRTFIRNVIKGDSPADFEALFGGWTINQSYEYKSEVDEILRILSTNRSYALIKSYLGYAKKDANYLLKTMEGKVSDELLQSRGIHNKASHLYRGVETAKLLINNEPYVFCAGNEADSRHRMVRYLKNELELTKGYVVHLALEQINIMETLRTTLNSMLDSKQLVRRFDMDQLKKIDTIYKSIKQDNTINFGDLRYEITENGTTYQYN